MITYRGQERGILTCYPDMNLAIAKELMEAKGIKQLPVVKRGRERVKERKRRIVAVLHYDSILQCLRFEKIHQFIVLLNDTYVSFLTVNMWSLNSACHLTLYLIPHDFSHKYQLCHFSSSYQVNHETRK